MQRDFVGRAENTTCSAHRRTNALQPTYHLQRLYRRAGILGATSHSGRRTWLIELSAKGVGVRVLTEMAGHAGIQTT
jgi:integrase/recombinase XerD